MSSTTAQDFSIHMYEWSLIIIIMERNQMFSMSNEKFNIKLASISAIELAMGIHHKSYQSWRTLISIQSTHLLEPMSGFESPASIS
jgi:hypothetical protein